MDELNASAQSLSQEELMILEAQADILREYRSLLIAVEIGYAVNFALFSAVIIYLRHHRNIVYRGDSSAARKLILPAYESLLWVLAFVSGAHALYFTIHLVLMNTRRIPTAVELEAYYSGRLFTCILTMVYLHQKSVSTPALQRACGISLLMATYTLPIEWAAESFMSKEAGYWVPTITRALIFVYFVYVFFRAPARATKHSIRQYCVFIWVYFCTMWAFDGLLQGGQVDAGFAVIYINIAWSSLSPFFIWRVLRADTEHWRGLGRRAVQLQSMFRSKNNIHERISSHGLHVLIEMHRKYIIDFAYLEFKRRIGTGSSADVFSGTLHSKTPVAIKVYTPESLTDDVVAEFSHEAALCGSLHHANIVKFYGLCISPPTICLVSELCQGPLDEITRAVARQQHDRQRQQALIDINYMIDCVRAVAYLHSFTPAFVHRDIKPSNYLLDAHCTVKLTDFGESRSLPSHNKSGYAINISAMSNHKSLTRDELSSVRTPQSSQSVRNAMTVRGTPDYMAPELIQGKAGQALYGEAADIYSLTITLWDILHPLQEHYPEANGNHLKVFENVLNGARPALSSSFCPELGKLLTEGWDARPERRPSAQYMLQKLEHIQESISYDVAALLAETAEDKQTDVKKDKSPSNAASGHLLMQRMLEFDFVSSVEEARRMGNGLMSAGYLHHSRHQEPFLRTTEKFFFDDRFYGKGGSVLLDSDPSPPGNTQWYYPFQSNDEESASDVLTESIGRTSSKSTTLSDSRDYQSYLQQPRHDVKICACRKLGRGMNSKANQPKRFRHNKRWYAVVEESVLTENLLSGEFDQAGNQTTVDEYDALERVSEVDSAILEDSGGEGGMNPIDGHEPNISPNESRAPHDAIKLSVV